MITIAAIEPHWLRCLELAIEGYRAGSLAIAAVICSDNGEILSEGRNWLYDSEGPKGAITDNLVAHAELNAIDRMPKEHKKNKKVRLYTTMEPCPMCIGAIVMSPVRWVCAAIRDPWAGSFGLLLKDRYMESKKIHTEYSGGSIEKVFLRLNSMSQLHRLPGDHPFYSSMETSYPGCMDDAKELSQNGQMQTALENKCIAEVVSLLMV